ncbi:MAG: hypothetical protein AB1742_09680 [bacterium]
MERPRPPEMDNIREIKGSFGWVDHRIKWFWDDMDRDEILLYFFLISVSNEQGCSWWSSRKITKVLKIGPASLIKARKSLEKRRLIATRKEKLSNRTIYQVLPLPIDEGVKVEIPIRREHVSDERRGKRHLSDEQFQLNAEGLRRVGDLLGEGQGKVY